MTRHSGHPGPTPPPAKGPVADTRGGLKLAVDGTRHITGLVEALHGQIQRFAPPLRRREPDAWPEVGKGPGDGLPPTRGITGLVYRTIQGTPRWVGDGLDGLLAPFDSALANGQPSPRRDAVVAALGTKSRAACAARPLWPAAT